MYIEKFCPQIHTLANSIDGFKCEYDCKANGENKTIATGNCVRTTSGNKHFNNYCIILLFILIFFLYI